MVLVFQVTNISDTGLKISLSQVPSWKMKSIGAGKSAPLRVDDHQLATIIEYLEKLISEGKIKLHLDPTMGTIERDLLRKMGSELFSQLAGPAGESDSNKNSERQFMAIAVAEAKKCKPEDGRIHPKVGAVVVRGGKVIASAHRGELGPGEHAEFTVLEKKLNDETLTGAIIYATLEPCTNRNHPKLPCAKRIMDRKISRVVIGTLDPNPVIRGQGILALRDAGIEVALFDSDMMTELEELNRDFNRQFVAPTVHSTNANIEKVVREVIDSWAERVDIDNWQAWSSWLLGADQPRLDKKIDGSLGSAAQWLLALTLPKQYAPIEDALMNFCEIAFDLRTEFHKHSKDWGDFFITDKFYQIREWDDERYHRLHREYLFHVKLIDDLTAELTRAANLICNRVRQCLDPTYRLMKGNVLISSGPYMDLTIRYHALAYTEEEARQPRPYASLEAFKKSRSTRDHHFGVGIDANDPEFRKAFDV